MPGPLQALANKSPIPFAASRNSFGFGDDGSAGVDQTQQLGTMERVSTLFSIVDLIASKVASVDWHLYRTRQDPEEDRVEVFDHPALVVWDNPATVDGETIYTQDEFIEATQQHYELTGEMDIVVERKSARRLSAITDLWPVRPDRIKPIRSRTKFLSGYVYTLGEDKIPLAPSQVIVEKRQNPLNPWRGLSPLRGLALDIAGEEAAAAYNYNFFVNGARPGGILELDRETLMEDAEWEAWVQRWRSQHQGVSNAHRIAVMEMGKFSDNKITQKDMEFLGLRVFSREAQMEAYRVSKAMLGKVEDVNRSNNDAQQAIFSSEIVVPRLQRWRKLLNRKFLPKFGALGDSVDFDYTDPTPTDATNNRLQDRADVLNITSLVQTGYDPDEVLAFYDFPAITYVGPPSGGAGGVNEPGFLDPIDGNEGSSDD